MTFTGRRYQASSLYRPNSFDIGANVDLASHYCINRSNVTCADRSFNPTRSCHRKNVEKSTEARSVTSDDPTCQFNANFRAANREIGFSKLFRWTRLRPAPFMDLHIESNIITGKLAVELCNSVRMIMQHDWIYQMWNANFDLILMSEEYEALYISLVLFKIN